jgi:hypothetical protein
MLVNLCYPGLRCIAGWLYRTVVHVTNIVFALSSGRVENSFLGLLTRCRTHSVWGRTFFKRRGCQLFQFQGLKSREDLISYGSFALDRGKYDKTMKSQAPFLGSDRQKLVFWQQRKQEHLTLPL